MKIVSWFSAGVCSAVATKIAIDNHGCTEVYYNDIEDHHPDNKRFLADCEKWFGLKINILTSPYKNVDNVIKSSRFISSPYGAACSRILKRRVRKEWEQKQTDKLCYVWGMDSREKKRAKRLVESMPEQEHMFPLIEHGIFKEWAHWILLKNHGIEIPVMYDLGFPNNNCIGCVMGKKGYWNLIKKLFPEVFKLRAETERLIGHSCMNGIFLDELPEDTGRCDPIVPECDLFCMAEPNPGGLRQEWPE